MQELINLWNETFLPLNREEKKRKAAQVVLENRNKDLTLNYDEKLDQIKIQDKSIKCPIIIDNLDKYVFNSLCPKLISIDLNEDMIDFYKTKYLKPSYYNKDLFVNKKKNVWMEIIFKILNSKSYNEIRKSLYNDKL